MDADDRPLVVDRYCRIGDWESDTIVGKDRKSIVGSGREKNAIYCHRSAHWNLLAKAAVARMKTLK